jgi:hypothetical protein
MIRSVSLCTILLAANAVFAEPATTPTQQLSQPPNTDRVRTASAEVIEKSAADRALLEQKIAERDDLQRQIDELRQSTGTPQQILVRLQVIEVSRAKLQRLGVDIATTDSKPPISSILEEIFQIDAANDRSETGRRAFKSSNQVFAFIRQLTENNIAKVF